MNARLILAASMLASACATTPPAVESTVTPPNLPEERFDVVTQNLSQIDLKYTGTVQAAETPITVQKARWEFVVDGEVKRSGEAQLNLQAGAGEKVDFTLSESLAYVKDEAELQAMDTRGGSLLLAMRGTLMVAVPVTASTEGPASTRIVEVPFAKSKEVRTPRLPHVKIVDFEAGRFSDTEVQAVFHVGVVNPNPFDISLSGLDYTVELAGKQVSSGSVGAGERVTQASTGVFDVTATLNETTHGKEAGKLVKGRVLPYVVKVTMRAPLATESTEGKGDIKLTAAK